MEEVKKEEHGAVCHDQCMNVHRYCGKHICVVRMLFVVIVLVGVFVAGFASGVCAVRDRYADRSFRVGYGDVYGYGNHLMRYDGSEQIGWESVRAVPSTHGNVVYRMMGQPVEFETYIVSTGTPR